MRILHAAPDVYDGLAADLYADTATALVGLFQDGGEGLADRFKSSVTSSLYLHLIDSIRSSAEL